MEVMNRLLVKVEFCRNNRKIVIPKAEY